MKLEIDLLDNKIREMRSNHAEATINLKDSTTTEGTKMYYKTVIEVSERMIAQCQSAIKILSNEPKVVRNDEQNLKLCPNCIHNKAKAYSYPCRVCSSFSSWDVK